MLLQVEGNFCSDRSDWYLLQVMLSFLKEFETRLGIKIVCSQETEPMGTAGPLALARDKLDDGSGDPFFVLNSDVISEYPLREMIAFHKKHGGEASIMVTKVRMPSIARKSDQLGRRIELKGFERLLFASGTVCGQYSTDLT